MKIWKNFYYIVKLGYLGSLLNLNLKKKQLLKKYYLYYLLFILFIIHIIYYLYYIIYLFKKILLIFIFDRILEVCISKCNFKIDKKLKTSLIIFF